MPYVAVGGGAVYWHIGSKENLIRLAGDEVWREVPLPDLGKVDWRTAAAAMAKDLYLMLTRHPWLVSPFGSYLLYGPGKARYDDHSLALYETARFDGDAADRASATVFTFVLGNALGEGAGVSLTRRLGNESGGETRLQETMTRATEIGMQFPRLRERIQRMSDIDYSAAPAESFEFGLAVILDGFALHL